MLGWLFRRPVTRERAIALAIAFLAANDCRIVTTETEVDWAGNYIPVVFSSASLPGRRWYVEFVRVMPPGVSMSNTHITVYVWAATGRVTFDHFEDWE